LYIYDPSHENKGLLGNDKDHLSMAALFNMLPRNAAHRKAYGVFSDISAHGTLKPFMIFGAGTVGLSFTVVYPLRNKIMEIIVFLLFRSLHVNGHVQWFLLLHCS
jgi:hypothetical protein